MAGLTIDGAASHLVRTHRGSMHGMEIEADDDTLHASRSSVRATGNVGEEGGDFDGDSGISNDEYGTSGNDGGTPGEAGCNKWEVPIKFGSRRFESCDEKVALKDETNRMKPSWEGESSGEIARALVRVFGCCSSCGRDGRRCGAAGVAGSGESSWDGKSGTRGAVALALTPTLGL